MRITLDEAINSGKPIFTHWREAAFADTGCVGGAKYGYGSRHTWHINGRIVKRNELPTAYLITRSDKVSNLYNSTQTE